MRRFTGLALPLPLLFLCLTSHSQQLTRSEVGLGVYRQSDTEDLRYSNAAKRYLVGPFTRYTLNLNRSVALETSVSDSIDGTYIGAERQGGHEVLVLGGLKAGVRRRYFGVYGRLGAGAASYSRGAEFLTSPPTYFRNTHFALQPGIALEVYPTKRTILRLDIDEDLNAVFGRHVALGPNLEELVPGSVPHHAGLSLSVAHRFGSSDTLKAAPEFTPKPEHISFGAFFPLQIRQHLLQINSPALGGGGIWVEFPLYRFLSADIIAFDIPHDDRTADIQDGGTSFSAFAGPKVGFHLGHFGLFAKGRPGITRFSRTEDALLFSSRGIFFTDRPKIDFTLDTGGVLEYIPSRHAILRFEAGDAFIHYHGSTDLVTVQTRGLAQTNVYRYAPIHNASILFLAGLGWRF
jgi:hypothetical protein